MPRLYLTRTISGTPFKLFPLDLAHIELNKRIALRAAQIVGQWPTLHH
jgi:hypothetical protein